MNPEIKKEWLAALRSGEYKQGRLKLAQIQGGVTKYCCLGVLCDLAVKHGIIDSELRELDNSVVYGNGFDTRTGVLPEAVRDWAGLERINPSAGHKDLATWNDETSAFGSENRYSFTDIANIIEEHL